MKLKKLHENGHWTPWPGQPGGAKRHTPLLDPDDRDDFFGGAFVGKKKKKSKKKLSESVQYTIEPSQGDGWKIQTPHGYIDYRHADGINEIWWVESNKRGHGSELVDLMQKHHPAETIAWGVTSGAGRGLMKKWHRMHPEVEYDDTPHEGQFDPF
jgi:hypothetical protein